MAVTDITQEILDWFNVNDTEEVSDSISEVWDEFYETLSTKEHIEKYEWAHAPVLPSGPAFLVEDFGGEGQGETRYVVFSVGEQFFRVDGYYASWDGTTWEDPTPSEVIAKEVTVIRYERA
jgi:hypothetical protein